MTRKFLEFYNATHHNMDAVEIYNIWKEKYGFAAVPPGDQGQKIVLDSLFKVYPNYAKAIQTIETFTPDESTIYDTLTQVKSCLGFHESIDLVVIYFVGFFENNAFVAPYDENTFGLEDYQYLTDNKAWFESCKKSHTNIMRGIQPYLDNDDAETIFKIYDGPGYNQSY